jgi:hypothetical protein
MLPNSHGLGLVSESTFTIETLEMRPNGADGNTKVSSDLLVGQAVHR